MDVGPTLLVGWRELQRLLRDRTFWVLFFFQVLMVVFAQAIVHNYAALLFPSEAGEPPGGWRIGVVTYGERPSVGNALLEREQLYARGYTSLTQAEFAFMEGRIEVILVPPPELGDQLGRPVHVGISLIHDPRSLLSSYTRNRLEEALVELSHTLGFERLLREVPTVPQVRVTGVNEPVPDDDRGAPPLRSVRPVHALYGFLVPFIFLFLAINAGDVLMEALSQDTETHKLEPLVHTLSPGMVVRGKVAGALMLACAQAVLYIVLLETQGVRLAHPVLMIGYALALALLLAGVGLAAAAAVPGRQELRFVYFGAMSAVFVVNLTPLPLPESVVPLVPSACLATLAYSPVLGAPVAISFALLLGSGLALVRIGEIWFEAHPERFV